MAAADPGASAVALVSTPATDGGILSLLMSAALPPVQVDVVVGHAPSKAVRSSGITSASNGRIGEESRLAIENSVKEQDNARSKVSREFTEYNADIERLRKEEIVTCDVPALGGHMPFLVLELPVQATNPHIRPGQKKGTCHHWVVDPVYLLNASKANYELELRLAEIDVSIQRIEDSIVTKQEVMGELEDERDELESGSERNNINQRIRRASESLEKLNKIKARLVNDKEALQAAVDGAAAEGDDYVERAKWTWVTADNILEDISGVNELHPKYTVASHTGIYTDNHSKAKEAQGKRLCAVASLALADDAHDLTSETQNVIVSVTLMAFINSQWRCAVQSEDNPPGRVMKINKTAWRQRQYAKVAEQAEDGLNRTLGLILAQLAFSSTTDDVGRQYEGDTRPNVWTWWNSLSHTESYLLGEEYKDETRVTPPPLAYDTTEGARPQSQFKLLFVAQPPAEAGLYSLICFLRAKSHQVKDKPDLTWCETLFNYEATNKTDILEQSRAAVVSCAAALYQAYSIATDQSVSNSTVEAVTGRSLRSVHSSDDDIQIGKFVASFGGHVLPPGTADFLLHDDDADEEQQDAAADTAEGSLFEEGGEGGAAVVGGDAGQSEDPTADTADRAGGQQKAIRQEACQSLFKWLRHRNSPHFASLDADVLSAERNYMAGAYASSLRSTTEFSSAMAVAELSETLKRLWRVTSRQAKKLSEQQKATLKLIAAVVESGIHVEVEGTQYKVELVVQGASDPRIQLLDKQDQPCGAPPEIEYFNENDAPMRTAITNPILNRPNGSFHVALLQFLELSGIKVDARLQAVGGGAAAATAALPAPVDEAALRAEYTNKVRELEQRLAKKDGELAALQAKARNDLNSAAADKTVAMDAIYLARAQNMLALATNINQDDSAFDVNDPGLALFKALEMHLGTRNVPAAVSATAPVSAVMRVARVMKKSDAMAPAVACQHIARAIASIYEPMGELSTVVFKVYKYENAQVVEKMDYKMSALTATFFFLLFPGTFVDLFMPHELTKYEHVKENMRNLREKCYVRPKSSNYKTLEAWTVLDRKERVVQVLVPGQGKKNLNAKYLLSVSTLDQFKAEPSKVNDALPLPELIITPNDEPTSGPEEFAEAAAVAVGAFEAGDGDDEGQEEENVQPKRRVSARAAAAVGEEKEADTDEAGPASKRAKRRADNAAK